MSSERGPYWEIGKDRVIGQYGWRKEADGLVRVAVREVCKAHADDEAKCLYWADVMLSLLAERYPDLVWRWPSTKKELN